MPAPASRHTPEQAAGQRRRAVLGAGIGCLPGLMAGIAAPAAAHNEAGRVDPPLPAPALLLTREDATRTPLPEMLKGKVTALQLMFTGCTATCPIQGAMFAAVQAGLQRQARPDARLQLLSLSIDALSDDPPALARWLRQQGAGPRWRAAVPSVAGVDTLLDFLRGRSVAPDRHTAQVYVFGRRAELLLRSTDFPAPSQVLGWLTAAAGTG